MLGLSLSSKWDCGSCIISIAKNVSKKIGDLILSANFFLLRLSFSPINLTGAHSCYLEMLDKLQKQVGSTVGPSLNASLEPLAHPQNLAIIGITLVGVHLNWLNWFHVVVLVGGLLVILIDCMIFMSPFLDVSRMSMSTISFLEQLDSGIFCL